MRAWSILFAALLLFLPDQAGRAAFSLVQVSSSALPRGDVICDITTGVATGVGAGTCVIHPATCNGTADDAQAFADFNTWAVGSWQASHSGLIEMFIPSGKTCRFLSVVSATVQDPGCSSPTTYPFNCGWDSSHYAKGISKLLVNFSGASLQDDGVGTIFFYTTGGDGICHHGIAQANGCSARLNSATRGDTKVFLKDTSLCSRFTVGNYAVVAGFDTQGQWTPTSAFGYPPNPAFYEYVVVTSTSNCGSTGEVDFDHSLSNSYLSTWPLYGPGDSGEADGGGPATIYALPYWWNTQVEYRGGTINQVGQSNDQGNSVTYRNVTMVNTACAYPTQNITWLVTGGDWSSCSIEEDKVVVNATYQGVHVHNVTHQSMSPQNFTVSSATIDQLVGTPRNSTITNSTLTSFAPGTTSFGRTDSVSCSTCSMPTFTFKGASESGTVSAGTWGLPGQAGGPYNATMSAGTITIPNTHGSVGWAVPNTNLTWMFSGFDSAYVFQVTGVTQDATNTYVATNCVGSGTICGVSGTFPVSSGTLQVHAHPAPQFTCSNCSGSTQAAALNNATPGSPLFSYSKVTYDETWPISSTASVEAWGKVTTLNFTVTNPYGGVGALSFFPMYQFGYGTVDTSGATHAYTPNVDLKTGGLRTITTGGVTGSGGADSGLTLPGDFWFTGQTLPNISAHPGGSETITIELITNQGVVNPPLGG